MEIEDMLRFKLVHCSKSLAYCAQCTTDLYYMRKTRLFH